VYANDIVLVCRTLPLYQTSLHHHSIQAVKTLSKYISLIDQLYIDKFNLNKIDNALRGFKVGEHSGKHLIYKCIGTLLRLTILIGSQIVFKIEKLISIIYEPITIPQISKYIRTP
jgi:hypothetical protein